MKIATNHISVAGALIAILAVVAGAKSDGGKWRCVATEKGLPAVVFVTDDITKLVTVGDNITDEAFIEPVRFDIEQPDTFNS